jgi:hypothetical protein
VDEFDDLASVRAKKGVRVDRLRDGIWTHGGIRVKSHLTILENTLTIEPHLLGGFGTGFSWHRTNSVMRNYLGCQWPMARLAYLA